MRFEEKTVVVTGASTGIGAAAARRFASEGARLVLVARSKDGLDELADELDADRTLVHPCDVGDEKAVEAMIAAAVERFGGIDVLVTNAGIAKQGDIAEIDLDDYRSVLRTNIDGVVFCTRFALPHLEKSGGAIVNTASVSGLGGDWGMSVYNLTKGAIVNFTRAVAMDYGRRGVRVNAVAPSLTRSELTTDIFENPELLAKFEERISMGRGAEAEDIAGPIAFLASDDARFVTGVVLPVDGGLTASNGQPPQA